MKLINFLTSGKIKLKAIFCQGHPIVLWHAKDGIEDICHVQEVRG